MSLSPASDLMPDIYRFLFHLGAIYDLLPIAGLRRQITILHILSLLVRRYCEVSPLVRDSLRHPN